MAQIITQNWWWGWWGGGWSGDMLKCVYDPNNVNANAFDYNNFSNTPDLSCYQTKDCMVCDLCGADDDHYPSAKAVADAIGWWGWSGDMLKCVYDPNNHNADAFDYCNFTNTPTIPTDNCQLSNGCCYAKTCDIPTNNCQLTNWCGYTTCTWTLTASNISDTSYGSSWCWVTTVAPSKNAVYAKVNSIDELIPSAATCSNQLADKDYVNDSINSVTAYYITKNAQGDQFACYAELAAATTFYSGWVQRTPTRNDYTIVADDECYNDATTRYLYNSGWEFQYCINESPMTTAQVNAINSWITCTKVSCYDCCMAQCCDIPTDNCQLCNGCGYTTCTGTLSSGDLKTVNCCSLVGSGDIEIEPWITKIFTLSSTSDLVNAQAAYDRYVNWGNPVIRFDSNWDRQYYLSRITTNYIRFSHSQAYSTWLNVKSINLNITWGAVSTIVEYNWLQEKVSALPATPDANTVYFIV